MKIISLAGKTFGVLTLSAILEKKEIELVGVVPGDDQVFDFAKGRGLHIISSRDVNSDSFIDTVRNLKADLLINTYFLQRYKSKILREPKYGVLNIHPSKLPLYRGRDCVRWAMVLGENEIGVTAHLMDEDLDTGDIVVQNTFPINIDDNYGSVIEKLKVIYPKTATEAIDLISHGLIDGRKQSPCIEGTYYPHRTQEDSQIKWSENSNDIFNLIRASYEPGFYTYSFIDDKKIFITRASLVERRDYEKPHTGKSQTIGRVLDYDKSDPTNSSMLVGTMDGVIRVEKCGPLGNEEAPARLILKRGNRFNRNLKVFTW